MLHNSKKKDAFGGGVGSSQHEPACRPGLTQVKYDITHFKLRTDFVRLRS